MDLNNLKPVERIIQIVNPVNGQELGVKVSLLSITDSKLLKVKRRIVDEKLRLEARGKIFKSEDIEENGNALIFNAMTGWEWSGDATFKGKKPVFDMKTVLEILTELPWFKKQIEEALEDEQAFFPI